MIIIDNKEIKLVEVEEILKLEEDLFVVKFPKKEVSFFGRHLSIAYIDDYEIHLKGEVNKIEFKYI